MTGMYVLALVYIFADNSFQHRKLMTGRPALFYGERVGGGGWQLWLFSSVYPALLLCM
jgi:hypothetical protein